MSKHHQSQELKLGINPKHLQLLSLLQTPLFLLEQRLKTELEKNVLLEYVPDSAIRDNADSPEFKEDISPSSDYDLDSTEQYNLADNNLYNLYDRRLLTLPSSQSARELLQEQLIGLNLQEQESLIVEFLIESLDDNGLLSKPLLTLSHDLASRYELAFDNEQLQSAIKIVQSLDPPGTGARNVAESLSLQLKRLKPLPKLALTIIQNHYNDFLHNNLESLKQNLNIKEAELSQALKLITSLRPYPFLQTETSLANQTNRQVIPDFILHREQGKLILQSQQSSHNPLRISNYYTKLLESYSSHSNSAHKEAYLYLKDKYKKANDLLDNLQSRNKLLFTTTQLIVNRQREFFLSGDYSKIKPLTLKDLTDSLDLEISTLSRIVQNKYIATDFGIIALKDCFIRTRSNKSGEELNPNILEEQIQQIIQSESADAPYNDEQIQQLLSQRYHTNLARRTIAKYRQKLSIPAKDERARRYKKGKI